VLLGNLAAPCFDAVRDAAARLPEVAWPSVAEIDRALAPLAGVRFVAGDKARPRRRRERPIDPAELYEIRVAERREVPTRADCAHDLLNALAWAAFPAAKWALATRLADAQRARLADDAWRLPGRRTRAHDRLALLDEGGILIAAGSPDACGLVFGHALVEHALAGRLDVWGAAIALPVDPSRPGLCARLDAALADALADGAFLATPWPRLALGELAR
jgi:hypothetical protein